jgi:hypothetical protein
MIHDVGTGPQKSRVAGFAAIVAEQVPLARRILDRHREGALRDARTRTDIGVGLTFAVTDHVAFDDLDGVARPGDHALDELDAAVLFVNRLGARRTAGLMLVPDPHCSSSAPTGG